MSVTLTLLLTAVAYKLVLGDGLPKVAYLTCIDNFFFISIGSLFVCSIIALAPSFVQGIWGEKAAQTSNFWMFWIFIFSLIAPVLCWSIHARNIYKSGDNGIGVLTNDKKKNLIYFSFEDVPFLTHSD